LFNCLGGRCSWDGCKIKDFDMLTLDHVYNDGAKERIRKITSGDATYRRVLKLLPSRRYQLLCANHNLKKQLERLRAERI
jgi:hypothetical protein